MADVQPADSIDGFGLTFQDLRSKDPAALLTYRVLMRVLAELTDLKAETAQFTAQYMPPDVRAELARALTKSKDLSDEAQQHLRRVMHLGDPDA